MLYKRMLKSSQPNQKRDESPTISYVHPTGQHI